LCDSLESIVLSYPHDILWIAGDLNLPDINWTDSNIAGNNYPLPLNAAFLNFVNTFGLTQVVDFPTRQSNTLDIFLTNRPSLIEHCVPIAGISDHEAVLIKSYISIIAHVQSRRKIYLWNKSNSNLIRAFFYDFCNEFLNNNSINSPINQLWSDFQSACHFCLDNLVPSKLSSNKTFHQPWITTSIKRLCRRKRRAYTQYRRSRTPSTWLRYKTLKNLAQKECRQAHNNYFSRLIDSNSPGNSKKLWSYIKRQKVDHIGIPPLHHNGNIITEPTNKANILNSYFSSVFTTENIQSIHMSEESPYPDIGPLSFSVDDTLQLLTSLEVHKAPGPDQIPSQLLRLASHEIAPILTLIFNSSLHQGKPPSNWKNANIVPIHKKGDKSLASNYRPISLTSISCKIMERLIHTHLFSHLESHNILCDQQHGFRPRRSCESQLITTVNNITKALDRGLQTDIIFLDLSKAFDKVPHHHLCNRLSFYGIRGNILTWIQNFLSNRHQQVILEGSFSESQAVKSGVPQGTILAPLLFLIYINDLPLSINANIGLYADDTILYSIIHSISDCHALQEDLNTLSQWATRTDMYFNPDKSVYMRITRKHNPVLYNYTIDNTAIQQVSSTKYLGITISNDLTWSTHINNITSKALSTKAFLQRNLKFCPAHVKLKCYNIMIRPILEYASPVWSPHTRKDIEQLERVQRQSARFIMADYSRFSSVSDMLSNLNLPSLEIRRQVSSTILFYKTINNLIEIPSDDLTPVTSNTRGHDQRFLHIYARTTQYSNSFFPRSVRFWNTLPHGLIHQQTLQSFKNQLKCFLLSLTNH